MNARLIKRYISLMMISWGIIQSVFAQDNPILEHFSVNKEKGKVYLSWTIVSGSTCNGIQILRSKDSISFEEIGKIEGVCGSNSTAIRYSFTDNQPKKNNKNYYRLSLGASGNSNILAIEIIDTEGEGFQIRPHPIVDKSKIFFENKTGETHELIIFNMNRIAVMRLKTIEEFFYVNTLLLESGIYLFTIVNDSEEIKLSSKLIISKQ